MVDESLLKILACPACRSAVQEEGGSILCQGCRRRYPIREGIPIMLIQEAQMPKEDSKTRGATGPR